MEENQDFRRSERILGRSKQQSSSDDESSCDDTAEVKVHLMFVPDVPENNAESQTAINRRLFEEIQAMKDKLRGLGESMDKMQVILLTPERTQQNLDQLWHITGETAERINTSERYTRDLLEGKLAYFEVTMADNTKMVEHGEGASATCGSAFGYNASRD